MARFCEVKDAYYRGNGRWAKITRNHRTNAKGEWKAYYTVAYGVYGGEGLPDSQEFKLRKDAEASAKEYIA